MATYNVTAPGGEVYEVTAPDNATQAQVLAYAQQNYQQAPMAKRPSDDEARLITALRNADAAAQRGDPEAVKAARIFARRIQELRRNAQTAAPTAGPWDRYKSDTQPQGPWDRYGAGKPPQGPPSAAPQADAPNSGVREVEMPDGTILEFPADTTDEVMRAAAGRYYAEQQSGRKGPGAQGGPSQPAAPPPPRSALAEASRQVGLGARHVLEGGGQTLGIFQDPIAAVGNSLLPGDPFVSGAYLGQNTADRLGLPKPENGYERVAGGISRAVVGGGGYSSAGRAIASAPGLTGQFGSALAARPGLQLLAAGSGGGAAETAKEAGAPPWGQFLAALAGSAGPSAGGGALRALMRGGETGRQSMLANMTDFGAAGAGTPTLAQATGGRMARGLEALLGRTPGSAGVLARASETQQAGMGQRVREVADSLSTRADPAQAGRAIERGITGPGGFMQSFRQVSNQLYAAVDRFIPGATPITVSRTKATLDQLASPTPGALQTSRALMSGKVSDLRNALDADLNASLAAAGRGQLPYEAVKGLRTRLGELIADSSLNPDMPTKQLKAVYAALSDDLGAAVAATGNPQAVQAAQRANSYFRAGMERLEVLERVIGRNGGPERVFSAATGGTRDGASTLRAVLQSLPEDGQKQLAAAVLRRMGRANPSAQDDVGETFSAERFLTMWNTLAPEAKSALFGRFGPEYVRNMEAIAKAAASRRAGAQVFRNPSQTTDAAIQAGTVFSFLTTAATGNVGPAAGIAAGVGIANGLARALTSPLVVKWLANQTTVPVAGISAQVAQLKAEAHANGDAEALEFAQSLDPLTSGAARPR